MKHDVCDFGIEKKDMKAFVSNRSNFFLCFEVPSNNRSFLDFQAFLSNLFSLQGVNYSLKKSVGSNLTEYRVGANYFMAYHTILKTSEDYYEAMRAARKVAANITLTMNSHAQAMGLNTTVEVFPYR